MGDRGPTDASGRLRQQWVVGAGRPGAAVRFRPEGLDCPLADGTWVEVRALTHREALERESVGVCEVYEVAEGGRELSLRRQYGFWAMAEYDYRHSLVAFQLPVAGSQTPDRLVASDDLDVDAQIALLGEMPPALAAWVERCIDGVNLRDAQGLDALLTAQKKVAEARATGRPGSLSLWHWATVEIGGTEGRPLREGHDFSDQHGVAAASGAWRIEAVDPLAVRLAAIAMHDDGMRALGAGLPDGGSPLDYPSWRVALWG